MPPAAADSLPNTADPPGGAELFRAVMEVAHLMARAGAESLRSHGVTPPQYIILSLLADEPLLNQQDIAARLHVTKGNISQIVATLEREGFVARGDGSRPGLNLTVKARQGLAALEPLHDRHMEACFGTLGGAGRLQLLGLLHRVRSGVLELERERHPSVLPPEDACPPAPDATTEPVEP
ncbi:MAG: MarR family winged helix-turn-helix transcriptional regulator [Anaerolineae bacterium]|jgi:DNA-binding MarR family transcriptional regulator|nr:winged helix-turn-helix transcriptional regulator [Ardenticatenia bacterium]HQZ71301.1 MarR family winged helix-turn-helix transcriptional regulator [Anaerolineae bacterium]